MVAFAATDSVVPVLRGEWTRRENGFAAESHATMGKYRNDEFTTASEQSPELKLEKERLRQRGYPIAETRAMVRRVFDADKFGHLAESKDKLVYLVAPSTTGENIIPALFAESLQKRLGGDIVSGWALPLNETRTGLKGAVSKLREPPVFEAVDSLLQKIDRNARLMLVDDIVTTGGTTRALRELLHGRALHVTDVLSLSQNELRKVSERDVDRVVERLRDPGARGDVVGVLGGQLRLFSSYVERILNTANDSLRLEIRNYFATEHQRLRERGLAHTGAEIGIGDGDARITGAQRSESRGAGISEGLSAKGGSVRGSANREESAERVEGLLRKLEAQQKTWSKATPAQKGAVVKEVEATIAEMGGSGVTGLPLKVAAKEFVQGRETKEALVKRIEAHVRLLARHNEITRGRTQSKASGHER